MIEDKDFKIAENEDVALWTAIVKDAEMLIKQSYQNIKVQRALKIAAQEQLAACQLNNNLTDKQDDFIHLEKEK